MDNRTLFISNLAISVICLRVGVFYYFNGGLWQIMLFPAAMSGFAALQYYLVMKRFKRR